MCRRHLSRLLLAVFTIKVDAPTADASEYHEYFVRQQMEAIRRVFFGCVASEPQVKNGPARPNADIYAKWDQKEMNGSIRGPVQGSVQQVTEDGQNEPAVHLTVVIDTSEAMTGPPAKAIAKGIRFLLLRHLQPTDVLTIWK